MKWSILDAHLLARGEIGTGPDENLRWLPVMTSGGGDVVIDPKWDRRQRRNDVTLRSISLIVTLFKSRFDVFKCLNDAFEPYDVFIVVAYCT